MPEVVSRRGRAGNIRTRRDDWGDMVWVNAADAHDSDTVLYRDRVRAVDRRCTACSRWLPQTTENFAANRSGGVSARCRDCTRQTAQDTFSTPAPSAAGTSPRGRYFGVELELTGPSAYDLIGALRGAGIRMASGNQFGDRMAYGHTNTNQHVWAVKSDSSVMGHGNELVSPKLRSDAGFEELAKVCATLSDCGATVDRSCGLHVHHDFRGLTLEQIKRQVLAMVDAEAFVMQMVAPSRRGNTYCPTWDSYHREQVENAVNLSQIGRIGPRGVVNLWAYGEHGSVEMRAHAGTTSERKIAAWIRFGQAVFAAAEDDHALPQPGIVAPTEGQLQTFLMELLPYGLQTADVSWLMRFVTVGETRQAVQERIAELAESTTTAESVLEEVSS